MPAMCDCCKSITNNRNNLTPSLNTASNVAVNVCADCLAESSHIIPLDECMPSGDIVM